MYAIGVIPARYDSTRFPGKALAMIMGKPMVCWVAEGAAESSHLREVMIASDDERILNAARSRGYQAIVTSAQHASGSDRVWEVAKETNADIVVNIQGDEPAIRGEVVDACIKPFLQREDIDVVTLKTPILIKNELLDPNTVKVVTDDEGFALYFSRAPVPYSGNEAKDPDGKLHFRHVGIYAYRRSALETFCSLPSSPLEKMERLEQLRGLAAGMRYFVVETEYRSVDVNTPKDLERAEKLMRRRMEEN